MKSKTIVQNKASKAWHKLCEYVDLIADQGSEEFVPREYLGNELMEEVFELPSSISKLTNVTKMGLYGSNITNLPPEIGQMKKLEYFDPYTSYNLHWFPYEILRCSNLKDSRISARALYGNFKNRLEFPSLEHEVILYSESPFKCSVCDSIIKSDKIDQFWVTQRIGTDVVPLLATVCSQSCKDKLPKAPEGYILDPHKGGPDLEQPSYEEWEEANTVKYTIEELKELVEKENKKPRKFLTLIRKIWEK